MVSPDPTTNGAAQSTAGVTFDVSMSPTIGKIAAALSAAQAKMGPAIRDREGIIPGKDGKPGYRYGYATLAACFEALQPLYDNGIALTQIPLDGGNGVRVLTYLLHESGEWIRGELWMPVDRPTPQGFGSALSYARRYGLQALTGLASDDDDGSVATHGASAQPTQPRAPAAPPQAKPGPRKAKSAPAESAPAAPDSGEAIPDEAVEALWSKIGTCDDFQVLHALTMDAQAVQEAARPGLFEAIANRGILLFTEAKDHATVKAGFALVTQLGRPHDLAEAANQAHMRFRQ